MNYAIPTNSTMVTSKQVARKKTISRETRQKKEFFASHRVSIRIDPETMAVVAEVTERK